MLGHRLAQRIARVAFVTLAVTSLACSDDETTAPVDPLIGTWQVSSFQALGEDAILNGMTMSITLETGGDYTFVVTGDQVGICGQVSSCTETGDYTSTTTQLVIDPSGGDAVTFTFAIVGSTMTWTGSIDGNAVTVVMTKS